MLKPSSTTTANLIKARELIADERNWCNRPNGDGKCALQALGHVIWQRARGTPEVANLAQAARELWPEAPRSHGPWPELQDVYYVNDHIDHSAVMRMFDRAIELSLQEQPE